MKSNLQCLILILLSMTIYGCGGDTDQLAKFKSGELVLWRDLSTTASAEDSDCGKIIENSAGLLEIVNLQNNRYDTIAYWGQSTPKQKIASYPIAVNPITGDLSSLPLSEAKISSGKLVVSAKRDDGADVEYIFKQGDRGIIQLEKWAYKNPSPAQNAEYERLKNGGFIKPVEYKMCDGASYKKFFNSLQERNAPPPSSVDSALDLVKSRTWSNVSCSGPKSMYVTYSPMFGEVTFVEGKTTLANTNVENEIYDDGPSKFSFKTVLYSDSSRTVTNAIVTGTVTLLSQDKIQVERNLKLGPPANVTKSEAVTYVACPQ